MRQRSFLVICCYFVVVTSFPSDVRRSDDGSPLSDVIARQNQLLEQQGAQLSALQSELGSLKTQVHTLQTQLASANEAVAFSTCLSRTEPALSTHARLKFPAAYLNLGGGFHAATSEFVAPVAGVYAIALKVMAENTMRFMVLKDGAMVAETEAADSDSADRAFVLTLVTLQKGQGVWVEKLSGSGTHVTGGGADSCFMGYMLHRL